MRSPASARSLGPRDATPFWGSAKTVASCPLNFSKDGVSRRSSGVYGSLECAETTADSAFEGSLCASLGGAGIATVARPDSLLFPEEPMKSSSLFLNSDALGGVMDSQWRVASSDEGPGPIVAEEQMSLWSELLNKGLRNGGQELKFGQQGVGDAACTAIAAFLLKNPSVQKVDLSGNNISAAGLHALLPSLRHLTSLKCLSLDWNPLMAEGDSQTFDAFVETLQSLPLEELSLRHCKLPPRAAESLVQLCGTHKHLRRVSVAHNALGEAAVGFLKAAKKSRTIVQLDAAGNGTSPALPRLLSDVCRENLGKLDKGDKGDKENQKEKQPQEFQEREEQQRVLQSYVQKVEKELSKAEKHSLSLVNQMQQFLKDSSRKQRDKQKENEDLREQVRMLQHAVIRSSSECEEKSSLSEENAQLKKSLEDRYQEICGLKLEVGELRSQQKFDQNQQRSFEKLQQQLESRIRQRQEVYDELSAQHQETQGRLREALSQIQLLQQLTESLKTRVETQHRQMAEQEEQRAKERDRMQRLLNEEKEQGERHLQEIHSLQTRAEESRQKLLETEQKLEQQMQKHRGEERRFQEALQTAKSEASSWKTKFETLEQEASEQSGELQRLQSRLESLKGDLATSEAALKKHALRREQQEAQATAAVAESEKLRKALSECSENASRSEQRLSEMQNELRQSQRELAAAQAKAEERRETIHQKEILLQQRSEELLNEKRLSEELREKLKNFREESTRLSEAAHRQRQKYRSAVKRIFEDVQKVFSDELQTLDCEA